MRFITTVIFALLVFSSSLAMGADVPDNSAEQIKLLVERINTSNTGKTGEYAKDLLDNASASINAAQAAISVGNNVMAQQKLETAEHQINIADAKATEKELVERVAVSRIELKKLESQLEKYRQGEGF